MKVTQIRRVTLGESLVPRRYATHESSTLPREREWAVQEKERKRREIYARKTSSGTHCIVLEKSFRSRAERKNTKTRKTSSGLHCTESDKAAFLDIGPAWSTCASASKI